MKKFAFIFSLMILAVVYIGCSDDDDPAGPDGGTSYDVEYRVISTGNVSAVHYLDHNGDTLKATNVSANWSYKWTAKGKSGDETSLKVIMNNSVGIAAMQILANNNILVADTLEGFAGATVELSRGRTLP